MWVVADGKSAHYYHADLGAMESMMVLTTGERINIAENSNDPIYCAKLRDESGYSITFEPKLYDGETELTVESITIGSNSGEEYYINGSFERKIEGTVWDDSRSEKAEITEDGIIDRKMTYDQYLEQKLIINGLNN